MEISGSYTFNAPPDRVWNLLMDPAVLSSCIPGCDRFESDGEDRYNVTLTRLYKDQESGEWRTSASFGRDDLLLVAQVCEMALVWLYQQGQNQNQSQGSEEVPF